MSTTQPIRSKQLLHDFKDYYLTQQPNFRNYTIILIGLNTALRINDILHLTWGDVYCTEHSRFYTHLLITEKKTGKETRILINRELQKTLQSYRKTQPSVTDTDYLFPVPEKQLPPSLGIRPTALSAEPRSRLGSMISCDAIPCGRPSATMHGKWELRPHC